jgi:hypothetical protein
MRRDRRASRDRLDSSDNANDALGALRLPVGWDLVGGDGACALHGGRGEGDDAREDGEHFDDEEEVDGLMG